ncbi:hypothetical protein ACQCSX_20560 [Pseudarthrobacter sp. P1]|uniref:hypothetical protein n=1 Tax=Pseudarthrobacter sp. P1 TaxID=3418418 RepID=UPI003CF6694A
MRRPFPAAGRRIAAAVLLACAGAAAAGCGYVPGTVEHYQPPAAPLVDAVACPGPVPASGSIPAGFEPVSAVVCSVTPVMTTGPQGLRSGSVEIHYAGDLGPLVAAVREPSDRSAAWVPCTEELVTPPALWLLDVFGRAMLAAWPTDVCGKPKPGIEAALGTLAVTETINR